ncbi:MAG: hypothetical protein FJ405_05380, partial [Verrucomicrobia bacterium]|nr:hypothetical protein [Verrucomicrobiota bacterium]
DGTANRLEVTMLGMGECLLDDVEVIAGNAQTPRLSNGTFESGLGPWTPQGNHISSRLETAEGYNSANSLRVRASARGDTGANRIRVALTGAVAENQPCVFRARVRWLRGWPEVILRLEGNGFELAGRMEVPRNLGTPGARNSIAIDNAPPAISEVRHTPVLPAGGEPVLVTARAHDSHGVGRLDLAYRLDPTTNIAIVPMKDDGSGGDALAADGIYSAFIPAQATGTLVGFHIQAADASPAQVSVLFPDDAPVRECLVRFGEPTPASGYATYHYYLTARNVATWINRPALSNERVEGTFVYGNFRAIYNISGKYSGSPYHQGFNSPVTDPCHFSLELPVDDMLLGTENFNKLHAPGNSAFDDGALQREQTAYWLMRAMDLPYNYRRFHAMYVNGIRKGSFMEDTQTPGSDIVDQRWPDDNDGHLYKLQPWFEFDDITVTAGASAGFNNVSWCTLMNFYTGPLRDQKKIARYRYNYLTRAANLTANDYTNVWDLTDAANTPAGGNYIGNMRQIVDMEQWLKTFAVQHGVGNWDSFGNRNSQNMYGYKPERGRWQLMTWDFNIVLGNSGSDGPTGDDIFQHNFADTAMLRIYQTPEFRRIYLRFIKELAEGPFRDPQLNALMIAKHAEFVNSGQTASNPSEIWGWLGQRRDYLLSQVRSYLTNFSVSTPTSYQTNASAVVVRGSAPLEVAQITVNGQAVPVVWFALPGAATISTQWRVTMPLLSGTNEFIFEGRDASGNVLSGMTITNVIRNAGEPLDPRGWVVFNEIMYNPSLPDASYLEIRNRSSSETFDLSGWRVEGVDYTFPTGSLLLPEQHLLLARERVKFIRAFPGGFPVFGEYNGGLANEGEVLSLIRPGANPANDLLVDRVRFDSALPWSQAANGGGVSLQLVDDAEDNSRSSNWADASRQEWQKVSVTSTNRGSILMFFMGLPGKVHIDDVSLTDSSGADVVINGSFESPLPGTWIVTTNYSATVVTSEVARSGSRSLWIDSRGSGGPTTNGSIWQVTLPILTNGTYTLTYHYLPTVTAQTIAARTFPLGGLSVSNSVSPMLVTPGFANNRTADLPEYPPLWLNEILPYNRNGAADAQGEREAWVELQNSGATAISMEGWFLSDDYGDLTKWSFPPNSSIQPREFKLIWLDGEPEASSSMDIHSSIVPAITNGSVVLSRRVGGRVQVVDYLNYRGLGADESYGSYPDAQPFYRQRLARLTPRAGNDATPPAVRINEWLADNSTGLTNPASGRFSDWFEIYNPADTAADLTGFFLSENPNNRNQFAIPPGTTVPARGYLLVWADNLPEANGPGVTDLHVNFALNRRNGGSLLIFSPSGEVVDRISFGTQTNDISMGRFPDGAESLRFMVRPTPRAANVIGSSENSAPTLAAMPDRNIAEETRLFFSATASDSENLPSDLVFSLDPGSPPGASILPDGRFRWRPTEAQGPGVYDIRVRVSDLGTPPLSDTKAFRVTVAEVNKPPLFDLRPQYGKTGQLLTFNTANDPDLPRQSLIYELLPDVPSGVQLDPASGLVSWTPSIDQAGRHVIRVKATDSGVPILSASYDYPVEIVRATQSLITLQLSIDQQGRVVIMARGPIGSRYQLESSTSIASPLWTAAGGVVTSIAEQTQLIDAQPGAAVKYYRVREIEP